MVTTLVGAGNGDTGIPILIIMSDYGADWQDVGDTNELISVHPYRPLLRSKSVTRMSRGSY
jgi:hypothetical protein